MVQSCSGILPTNGKIELLHVRAWLNLRSIMWNEENEATKTTHYDFTYMEFKN